MSSTCRRPELRRLVHGSTTACHVLPTPVLQIGADIVKRALPYSLKLIANNAGDNGSVVMQVRCAALRMSRIGMVRCVCSS